MTIVEFPCCGTIGDVTIRQEGSGLRILKADPRSAISDELWPDTDRIHLEHHEGVVTIRDDFGARYVYRDVGHCNLHAWHIIEWPD